MALDGSELAETALVPAAGLVAALAAPARGILQLTQVVPFSASEHEEAHRSRTDPYKKEEALYEAQSYLSAVADRLRRGEVSDLDLGVVCSVAAGKDVADTLIRMAEQGEAVRSAGLLGRCDLMVLATHGRNGLQRWTIGSVAEQVLGATKLPLLIVRPQEQQTTPERELTVKEQEQKEGRFTGGEFVRHCPRPAISSSHTATWSSCHARSK